MVAKLNASEVSKQNTTFLKNFMVLKQSSKSTRLRIRRIRRIRLVGEQCELGNRDHKHFCRDVKWVKVCSHNSEQRQSYNVMYLKVSKQNVVFLRFSRWFRSKSMKSLQRRSTDSKNSNNRRIMRTLNSKIWKCFLRSGTGRNFIAQLPVSAKLHVFEVT